MIRRSAALAFPFVAFCSLAAILCAQEWRGGHARVEGTVKSEKGEPIVGAGSKAHLLTSLNSEEEGGDDRKSEAPIRAMISGNAEGAKGRRSEIADGGNMTRHRADCVHGN